MNNKGLLIIGTTLVSCLVITGTVFEHTGWEFAYALFLTIIIPFSVIGMIGCAWNSKQHHNGKDKTREELDAEKLRVKRNKRIQS